MASSSSNSSDVCVVCCAENICEGFDHAEAGATDVAAAVQQLKQATMHEVSKTLASPSKRSGSSKASKAETQELLDNLGLLAHIEEMDAE